jgi:hypothetical protein
MLSSPERSMMDIKCIDSGVTVSKARELFLCSGNSARSQMAEGLSALARRRQ